MIDIIVSIFLIALCEELVLPIELQVLAWAAAICSVIKCVKFIVDISKEEEISV